MKIISIENLKGGPGKTTTAINMAYILAEKEKRVLLVDNDPQGNSSKFFGYEGIQPNINDVYMGKGNEDILRAAIKETKYKNLNILPSTDDLAGAIIEMSKAGEITILRECLQKLEPDYDFIIIDNSAQMTANVVNAIVASNDIIVPAEIDSFNMDGLDEIKKQIQNIKMSGLNDNVKFAGMLITRYNGRTKIDREP
jgi:chromosome partitioning protein